MIDNASVEPSPAVGDIGVPVNVAPVQTKALTVHIPFVSVTSGTLRSLMGVGKFLNFRRFGRFFGRSRRQGGRRGQGGKKNLGRMVGLVKSFVGGPAKTDILIFLCRRNEECSPVLTIATARDSPP